MHAGVHIASVQCSHITVVSKPYSSFITTMLGLYRCTDDVIYMCEMKKIRDFLPRRAGEKSTQFATQLRADCNKNSRPYPSSARLPGEVHAARAGSLATTSPS